MTAAKQQLVLTNDTSVDALGDVGCCSLLMYHGLTAENAKGEVFANVNSGEEITAKQFEELPKWAKKDFEQVEADELEINDAAGIAVVDTVDQKDAKAALEAAGFKEVARYTSTTSERRLAVMFKKPKGQR